ncbi:hypothetical protein [Clostridium sp. CF012]|uniref:hypothetical protein n=1 Tax=Clostridium sp. CF012 TaxID=2843319 RepID=UPI001C0E62C6|nr:hypothetical protein [Clostridium sp. CF012]MBU3146608.1 hypothetical protein [Clostridium sp. CF012]
MTINNQEIFTLKEIAEDIDKLIRNFLEMKVVTKYKNEEEINIQRLSLWSYNIQKKERERVKKCILKNYL